MLRRGFKSQCERRSTEIRKSLGLAEDAPLFGKDLAAKIGVTVWNEATIQNLPLADLTQLTGDESQSWSAFTLRIRTRHLVVYNSSQSSPRVNSVILHELAHIILGHELHSASLSENGHLVPSNFNQDQEEEADWLGGTLLLPRPALVSIRANGLENAQVIDTYVASEDMLKWRFRMTGVNLQFGFKPRR